MTKGKTIRFPSDLYKKINDDYEGKNFSDKVLKIIVAVPKLHAEVERLTLELQKAQPNETLEKDIISDLQPCVYRDLRKRRCRNKKAPLDTSEWSPEVCLACEELIAQTFSKFDQLTKIQKLFRNMEQKGQKVDLVLSLSRQMGVVEAERDDWAERWKQGFNAERSKWQKTISKQGTEINQLRKYASDLRADNNLKNMRIESLEAKLERLEENLSPIELEKMKTELEFLRNRDSEQLKKIDHLSRELELAKSQPMVVSQQERIRCLEKHRVVTFDDCRECPELEDCPVRDLIFDQMQKAWRSANI